MLLTLGAFIVVLGVLIFVHELGHFIAAKAVGVGVHRFSIGFGPATPIRFRRGETEYQVSWIPLGGYVKMASREEQEAMSAIEGAEVEEFPPEKLFESKSLPARFVVLVAGVTMNVVFAWAVYAGIVAVLGRSEDPTTTLAAVDAERLPAGAEALAALPQGTQIVRINDDTVRSREALFAALIDPTLEALAFHFAGRETVVVEVPGTAVEDRVAIYEALKPEWQPTIGSLAPGQPAAGAGLEPHDRIVTIDGDSITWWHELQARVEARPGDTLRLGVRREDSTFAVAVVPAAVEVRDPISGDVRAVGRIGIGPDLAILRVEFGLGASILEGGRQTLSDLGLVWFTLRAIVTGRVSARELGGPILIGQVSGQVARAGALALVTFMAFLSVNLAVFNLLPIPVLDGGHLVFLLLEGMRGRPLSLAVRLRVTQVGMLVLFGLVLFVVANDLLRIVGR